MVQEGGELSDRLGTADGDYGLRQLHHKQVRNVRDCSPRAQWLTEVVGRELRTHPVGSAAF